jgi:hypothetical protein
MKFRDRESITTARGDLNLKVLLGIPPSLPPTNLRQTSQEGSTSCKTRSKAFRQSECVARPKAQLLTMFNKRRTFGDAASFIVSISTRRRRWDLSFSALVFLPISLVLSWYVTSPRFTVLTTVPSAVDEDSFLRQRRKVASGR